MPRTKLLGRASGSGPILAPPAEAVAREPVKEVVNGSAPRSRSRRPGGSRPSRCRPRPSSACVRAFRGRTRPCRRPRRACRCRRTASRLTHVEPPRSSAGAAIGRRGGGRGPRAEARFPVPSSPGAAGVASRSSRKPFNSLWPKRPGRGGELIHELEVRVRPRAAGVCATRRPAGASSGARAARAYSGDPQIRRGRWHGLYALCRWLDRGTAPAGHGAFRLDFRATRAYRKQFLTRSAHPLGASPPAPVMRRSRRAIRNFFF